jgi:hypothetical protein
VSNEQAGTSFAHDDGSRSLIAELIRHRRGLIVGPHGTGKTTLIHSLLPRLRNVFSSTHLLQLTRVESTRWVDRWRHQREVDIRLRDCRHALTPHSLLLLDGAEQVSPWQRAGLLHRLRSRNVAILATSHRPLRGMPVLYQTSLNAKLISDLTRRLLSNAPAEVHSIVDTEIAGRDLNAVTNLRELWFELYDVVQPTLVSSSDRGLHGLLGQHGPTLVDDHGMSGS